MLFGELVHVLEYDLTRWEEKILKQTEIIERSRKLEIADKISQFNNSILTMK